jgi:hypothetical protein
MLSAARFLVLALEAYAAVGAIFGIAFVTRGAGRIDPVARRGTWGFKALVFPGVVALWPLLLRRWILAGARTAERR